MLILLLFFKKAAKAIFTKREEVFPPTGSLIRYLGDHGLSLAAAMVGQTPTDKLQQGLCSVFGNNNKQVTQFQPSTIISEI